MVVFVLDAQKRANTAYALTNQRAIIVIKGFWGTTKSFTLRNPVVVTLEQKPNRSGTIAFGTMQPILFRGVDMGLYPNLLQPLIFEEIPNAGEVYQMVLAAQQKAQFAVPEL